MKNLSPNRILRLSNLIQAIGSKSLSPSSWLCIACLELILGSPSPQVHPQPMPH
ncbi:hypothetical protein BDN72DRAFT_842407 [Pluteus cervinus]|uniref:Uncharacterized protein n=1 Tax=Pluteus cervinus TaxID=181527 RepID=A0ACD3ASX2_9AGAR|nr:hypothetical protein BDN72DRAFT_842407 [Pluteus cervinus]